ncbi:hypothetical protein [Streptomyces sp. NPDC091371]|uniref:hypothetical protein n=1 Tax=Streptomyces sp. NPDC091371 TaxID=3155303 RepID=UPI003421DE5B
MRSAPHLLSEDRQEYERILDEALRTAPERPELAALGERLTAEQLRTMALSATALLTAAAAAEYDHYVKVREERRYAEFSPRRSSDTVHSSSRSAAAPAREATDHPGQAGLGRRFGAAVLGAGEPGSRRIGDGVAASRWAGMSYGRRLLAALLGLRVRPEVPTAAGALRTPESPTAARTRPTGSETPALEAAEAAGAGLFTVFAVLAPVLSGTAAVVFFLIGLVLEKTGGESGPSRTVFAAGWLFVAVAVAAVVVCVVGLVVTALRNSSDQPAPGAALDGEPIDDQVARAREAWLNALLERGIVPFLSEALADPVSPGADGSSRAPRRIPNLGYSGPDFTSRGSSSDPAPSSHPSHTSPDFVGPENQPE